MSTTLRRPCSVVVAALVLVGRLAAATDVRVVGITPGRSVDVVVNGARLSLEVGEETPDGVKLLEAHRDRAVLRVDGARRTLSLVAERPGVEGSSGGGGGGGGSIVLSAEPNGQFFARGHINGRPVPCIIDTGASLTALSTASAQRIGLDYEDGVPIKSMTANGIADGWRISLDSIRIGDVTVRNVDAVVVDNDALPIVLLGMSYLGRFDMHRQGDKLVLHRRR